MYLNHYCFKAVLIKKTEQNCGLVGSPVEGRYFEVVFSKIATSIEYDTVDGKKPCTS